MQSAFVIVVVAVGAVGVIGAVIALALGRGSWESFGRDGLVMDSEPRRGHAGPAATSTPAGRAQRDAEIRQLLEARNRRRRRRGEPEVDVETELARLTAPAPATVDDELRGEIRDLVIARNHRRARRGEPPLPVETEVRRQLERLGAGD